MPLFKGSTQTQGAQAVSGQIDWSRAALDAAFRLSQLVASAIPPEDAMRTAIGIGVGLMGAEHASLMILDDAGVTLTLTASGGRISQMPIGTQISVPGTAWARALMGARPTVLPPTDPQITGLVPVYATTHSVLLLPVRSNGSSTGILIVALPTARGVLSDPEMQALQMVADQIGTLAAKHRIERAVASSTALSQVLQSGAQALVGNHDLDGILQTCLDGALSMSETTQGFASIFDPETGAIAKGVFRGLDTEAIRDLVARPEVQAAVADAQVVLSEGDVMPPLAVAGFAGGDVKAVVVLVAPPPNDELEPRLGLWRAQCSLSLAAGWARANEDRISHQLSSVMSTVKQPLLLVDHKSRLVTANPSAEQLFGMSSDFSAGETIVGRMGNEVLEKLLVEGGLGVEEVYMGNPPMTYSARVVDVVLPTGPPGRVLVLDDVSSGQQTAQTHRDFVAMIGHELRTPLTLVKGFARTLLRRAEKGTLDQEEARDVLRTIDGRAGQLERLIEDLLYVSKIETREATLRIEDVKIHDLVEEAVQDLTHDHPDRDVQVDIPSELTWYCDGTKVGLVIRHLIENALKYSEAPEAVTATANEKDGELIVEVADKGIGILSSDVSTIFDRFRQVDGTSTRKHGGTGIGLYLCAELINMHGGRIWVDSIWGKGSRFFIALPQRSRIDALASLPARDQGLV
ncbi:MAG TPA: ATP-binding protein [Actinomycetota bacterium]|nr:ATP-binding protein [Actinomycetota bacterium]